MSNILTLSSNIFDIEKYSKKEVIEMVENFNRSVKLLIEGKKKNIVISNFTVKTLKEFGFIKNENLDAIISVIGKSLFENLIEAINLLEGEDIQKYPDLLKYHLMYRTKAVNEEAKSEKPTLVDLFCGSGGLSLGLAQAGFRIIFANDIEKSALRTYSFNHPEVAGEKITLGGIESLVTNIQDYIKDEVDVVAGGPPCQGFSTANRQRIIDDPRNVLYKHYVEIVHKLQPTFFIMENVKGMLKVADQVIEDFNSHTKSGYDIDFRVLKSKFTGVPQNRERLFFIGIREDIAREKNVSTMEILSLIENQEYITEFKLMDAIKDLKKVSPSRRKNFTKGDEESGFIIDKNINHGVSSYVNIINNRNESSLIFNHKARFNNDRDIEIFGRMLPGDKSDSPRISDIMPYKSRSHMFKDKYYKLKPDEPCRTITAHMKFDCNMYIHPYQARGLTPREAARVQSYPDSYFFLGPYTKTYQQIGNSVPPLMAKKVGEIFHSIIYKKEKI